MSVRITGGTIICAVVAACASLLAPSAGAQVYGVPSHGGAPYGHPGHHAPPQSSYGGYGYGPSSYGHVSYGHTQRRARTPSWWDQRDRPGDYRCDAFWNANRTDCHEPWRDQRHLTSRSRDHGYGQSYGYGWRGHGAGYSHGVGYAGGHYGAAYHGGYAPRPGYGYSPAHVGYGPVAGAQVHHGAYGRPDLIYGGGGGWAAPGRDPGRVAWCQSRYRSYNPHTGYYLAYSGRYVFCG